MGIDPLEYVFAEVKTGLALIDGSGVIERVNPAGAAIIGRTAEVVTGLSFPALLHPDDVEATLVELAAAAEGGHGGPVHVRASRPDGSWVWVRAIGTRLPDDSGEPMFFVIFEDVTAEHEVTERLVRTEAAAARQAAQQAAVARLGRDALAGATIKELADEASRLVAKTLDVPFVGVLLDDGTTGGTDLLLVGAQGVLSEWVGRYRQPRTPAVEGTLAHREPTVVTVLSAEVTDRARSTLIESGIRAVTATAITPRNAPPGMLTTGHDRPDGFADEDITFLEAIANVVATALDSHHALDNLRFNALHDDLTGLPNRALLLDRLELALDQTSDQESQVAVLVCDIDRFKVINDGMGHAAGDEVLRRVAARLRGIVRPGDTVGRFGGDEFVVVCPEIFDLTDVVEIAERMAGVFAEPMSVLDTELVASVSTGIALGRGTGSERAAMLLRDADAAMYRAKARGRARYELFDDDMRAWATERLRTETELRHAIAHDELVLHYQPVLEVTQCRVVGVEALVRWQHPTRGLLLPVEFLGVAEDAGILADLDRWAFSTAAAQTARWAAGGGWDGRWTAVNLAAQDLEDPDLVKRIEAVIGEHGLAAARMRVELTEQAIIADTDQVEKVLAALRVCGVGVSIDDFGTGYSSLARLKRLPVDCLKLDRSFVSGLGERDDDAAISTAVISMARALALDVVAEGVETDTQLEVLRDIGCPNVQGYLLARPMPADDLEVWLATR